MKNILLGVFLLLVVGVVGLAYMKNKQVPAGDGSVKVDVTEQAAPQQQAEQGGSQQPSQPQPGQEAPEASPEEVGKKLEELAARYKEIVEKNEAGTLYTAEQMAQKRKFYALASDLPACRRAQRVEKIHTLPDGEETLVTFLPRGAGFTPSPGAIKLPNGKTAKMDWRCYKNRFYLLGLVPVSGNTGERCMVPFQHGYCFMTDSVVWQQQEAPPQPKNTEKEAAEQASPEPAAPESVEPELAEEPEQ